MLYKCMYRLILRIILLAPMVMYREVKMTRRKGKNGSYRLKAESHFLNAFYELSVIIHLHYKRYRWATFSFPH